MAKAKFSKKSHMENSGNLRPNQSRAPDERGDTGLPPEAKALLHTISGTESAGSTNVVYGGSHFNNYDDHPRIYRKIESGPNKGKYSSAAGTYQMILPTWKAAQKALDLPDFSPASQDKAAWYIASQQYAADHPGRDLLYDLQQGDRMADIGKSLAKQWTSLPGGIEQGQNGAQFASSYAAALSNGGGPVPPRGIGPEQKPVVPVTPTGAMQAGRGEHYFEPLPAPAPLQAPSDTATKGAGAGGAVGPVAGTSPRRAPFRIEGEPVSTAGFRPQPAVSGLGLTEDQLGLNIDRDTRSGYRAIQQMGPASVPQDPAAPQPAYAPTMPVGGPGTAPVAPNTAAPAAAAPAPMPGRPAAIDATAPAAVAKPAPAVDESQYATLPSGKKIKIGNYPSKNPGSSVTITRGDDGKAVITRHDPGILNPAKLGTNTLAGQFVRDQASKALADTKMDFAALQPVIDAVAAIQNVTSNPGEKITDAMSGATAAIGNFFGLGGNQPPANIPVKSGTKTLQDIHDARDDGAAKAPPTRAMQPVMPQGGPGTFPVAPNYQFGLSDAPGSEQPKLPIVAANRPPVEAPPAQSGSRPAQTVIVGQDGTVRPVQQTGTVAMGAKAPSSISQPTSAQLGLGQEPPSLAIVKAKAPDAAGGVAASIPKYITSTQHVPVQIAPTPQAMATLEDIHDRNDDRIVAAQQSAPQTTYKTVTTTTLNPEWVKAQQQAQGGAPAPRNRPTALTTPVAYKGTSTGSVYDVGSKVKASGGRVLTVQSDGSFKNDKTGQVSAGSSGKRYALLEEAGAYD